MRREKSSDCKNLDDNQDEIVFGTEMKKLKQNRLFKLNHECYDVLPFIRSILTQRYFDALARNKLKSPQQVALRESDLKKLFDQARESLHSNLLSDIAVGFKAIREFHDPQGVQNIFNLLDLRENLTSKQSCTKKVAYNRNNGKKVAFQHSCKHFTHLFDCALRTSSLSKSIACLVSFGSKTFTRTKE
jgi:hypothetical protein